MSKNVGSPLVATETEEATMKRSPQVATLRQLINRLCPEGVPFKTIKETVGLNRGSRLTKSQLDENAEYEVYHGSKDTPLGKYHSFNAPKGTVIVVNTGGIGGVKYLENDFWCSDGSFWLGKSEFINSKFLFYYLVGFEGYFLSKRRIGGVPTIDREVVENFTIPVPPIEVQEEIVRILDRFADYAAKLQAELQAELQARKEQYEYYRNLLLTFNPSACGCGTDGEQKINGVTTWGGHNYKIAWKPMGEICKIVPAPKKLNRKDYNPCGQYPIIDQGQDYIVGYSDFADALLPNDEYILFGDHTRNIKYFKGQFIQGADGLKILKPINGVLPKYLYHTMKTLKIEDRGYNRHWTVVSPILIPIPPLELQEKIVGILDRFETLVNDLTNGLPAEIAAVKQQYEYYRNKLLTFNEQTA